MSIQREMLDKAFEEQAVWRTRDLLDKGITFYTISQAMEDDSIAKIGPGIYASLLAASDQLIDYAILHQITGGVIYGLTAASILNMSTASPPAATQLIVPNEYNNRISTMNVSMWRTRNSKNLTVGVIDYETASGLTFKITGEARTLVDLYRDDKARGQFTREALSDYDERGGSMTELKKIANEFGVWEKIAPHTEMMEYYRNRGAVPK